MFLKKLVAFMGLTLDESEEDERYKIGYLVALTIFSPPFFFDDKALTITQLIQRLDIVNEAYLYRVEAKEALKAAVSDGGDLRLWKNAYKKALLTQDVEQYLLNFRLRLINEQAYNLALVLLGIKVLSYWYKLFFMRLDLSLLLSGLDLSLVYVVILSGALTYADHCHLGMFNLNSDAYDELHNAVIKSGFDLNYFPDRLVPQSMSLTGVQITDSTSLISLLINKENNAQKLERLNIPSIPNDKCCIITGEIMTDPVYSEEKSDRFERLAILQWLDKRKIHPCTNQPLYAGELKRDFPLKLAIDKFTNDHVRRHARVKAKKAWYHQLLFNATKASQTDEAKDDTKRLYQT